MSTFPFREEDLAIQAEAFAQSITPAKARWLYCFEKATFLKPLGNGEKLRVPHKRTLPICERILGIRKGRAWFRMHQIRHMGFDEAFAWAETRPIYQGTPFFGVGPMQAWHVGHIYFARVQSHPHVLKIGFSRRVADRLAEIESKCKTSVYVSPHGLKVGTLADEHWWHKNWNDFRISGEWFFDPHMSERTLPDFLADTHVSEAA
ncbi:GIY-YIG nuclease family protein [Phyllobacterium sp. YR531]|uniref:GIY-YIG nuclease family protein n=1 Tax=Phyllobacterium sp. YR531 TaxID=1144343 RepID=UPI00026FBAEC|nr:GIY-YIG nuclease family protein [Phyllobacterium sp. YR531]EJN04272.1 hypothetical protein PMI41_01911 [Phyllobacterium sp. YR531]